ncbi:MAG: HIT domain-containing protein [Rickettsiales bacterium]|nr:HIT domain-containing protein [Rickettsiales bacterium]
MSFTLHLQLAADTIPLGDLPHCRVLLMNNANFPWLILVPRRDGLRELFDLGTDYDAVMQEVKQVSEQFAAYTKADKINVAALGNMVPQLHIHIIARFKGDAAWPNPVWNSGIDPLQYSSQQAQSLIQKMLSTADFGNITNL